MSFSTPRSAHSIIISSGLSAAFGNGLAIEEVCTPAEEGWDTLLVTYLHFKEKFADGELDVLYKQGKQLEGTRTWWVSTARPIAKAPGVWQVEVTHKGWHATKAMRVRVGSAAESQTAENVTINDPHDGIATYAKAEVHQNAIIVTIIRFSDDVENDGKTEKVGTKFATLPTGVTVNFPPSVWTSINPFVYHYPNGWVLMGSEQDRLPGVGCKAAMITDTYKYIQKRTPG